MLNMLMLVELGLIRAGRRSLIQRYTEAVRRQTMASPNGDDIEARVRAMIVVGPGEEDEAREAYGDLLSDDQWLDRADWIEMEERG